METKTLDTPLGLREDSLLGVLLFITKITKPPPASLTHRDLGNGSRLGEPERPLEEE